VRLERRDRDAQPAARGFFSGAVAALRERTLDMNVLVAVAIGISWAYRWR
jgi:cation transport ATPase